jgi:hypothetical protein
MAHCLLPVPGGQTGPGGFNVALGRKYLYLSIGQADEGCLAGAFSKMQRVPFSHEQVLLAADVVQNRRVFLLRPRFEQESLHVSSPFLHRELDGPFTHPPGRNDLQPAMLGQLEMNTTRDPWPVNDLVFDNLAFAAYLKPIQLRFRNCLKRYFN